MQEFLQKPWPWYVAGPLIGLMVPVLLLVGSKAFGISSSLRHICAACLPAKIPFFSYDWRKEAWSLFLVTGTMIGGFVVFLFFQNPENIRVNPHLATYFDTYGIRNYKAIVPPDLFNWPALFTVRGLILMVGGGFLVGFGTRYADGCTSGHSIFGLSTLQWPSLVATCCFMIGGFIMSNLILPFILSL